MRYLPVLIIALVACGPSESNDGGGSSGSGSESTGTTAPTTSATTSTLSDTQGTMSASMSDTTTMTTTTATTTDTTETTVADSSGTSGGGSSGGGSSGSDSGSTGGAGNGVYDPCAANDPQCPEGTMCQQVAQGDYNFCTIPCDTEDDCPAPSSGDAPVNCGAPPMQQTRCQLACTMGETCPDGMECVEVGGGAFALCAWPA
jgi:hypothetical protein